MMPNPLKKTLFLGFATGLLIYFSGCRYDYIEFEEPPVTDTVYFSADIETIFNDNNNCTACHKAGATDPDLTTGNAYNSLQDMGLINLTTPDSSIIYMHPNPANPSVHAWKKYTPTEAALVLNWITQGALNNK